MIEREANQPLRDVNCEGPRSTRPGRYAGRIAEFCRIVAVRNEAVISPVLAPICPGNDQIVAR